MWSSVSGYWWRVRGVFGVKITVIELDGTSLMEVKETKTDILKTQKKCLSPEIMTHTHTHPNSTCAAQCEQHSGCVCLSYFNRIITLLLWSLTRLDEILDGAASKQDRTQAGEGECKHWQRLKAVQGVATIKYNTFSRWMSVTLTPCPADSSCSARITALWSAGRNQPVPPARCECSALIAMFCGVLIRPQAFFRATDLSHVCMPSPAASARRPGFSPGCCCCTTGNNSQ